MKIHELKSVGFILALFIFDISCSKLTNPTVATSTTAASTQVTTGTAGAAIKVYGPSSNGSIGPLIYSDTGTISSFNLKQGNTYTIQVNPVNLPLSSTFTLTSANLSTPSLNTTTQTLVSGNNTIVAPSLPGVYSLILQLAGGNTSAFATKTYKENVQCPTDSFSSSSLASLGITATSTIGITASPNTFSYQVTNGSGSNGVMPSANGIPFPGNGTGYYVCQLDTTGVGIFNTPLQDCSLPFTNPSNLDYATYTYSNYLGNRNLSLQVTDGCGYSYSLNLPVVLASPTPIDPASSVTSLNTPVLPAQHGTVFPEPILMGNQVIFAWAQFGQSSLSSGLSSFPGDPRVDNAYFLGTEQSPVNDDDPHVEVIPSNVDSNGVFNIATSVNYNWASSGSQTIALNIGVTGIANNIQQVKSYYESLAPGVQPSPEPSPAPSISPPPTPYLSLTNAGVSQVKFVADQYSDVTLASPITPALSMTSTTCTTNFINAQYVKYQNSPCTATGQTGANINITLEVWGEYTCTMVSDSSFDGGITVQVTGAFDGLAQTGDGCGMPLPVPPPPPGAPGPI